MTTQYTRTQTAIAARVVEGTKIYGAGETSVRALDEVSVDFARGAFTAIMGPSGSGKSTLLHCLAGLDTLSSGSVYVGDTRVEVLTDRDLTRLRRDQIGFIFQAFNLIPTMTAWENIVLPLAIANRKIDREWVDDVVSAVGLTDRLDHRPDQLSGGQQQRVAAARALASRPAVVFADEPSGNLDSKSGAELLDLLRTAVDSYGQTIVMVTHDPTAASYADRVVFLDDGKVVDDVTDPTSDLVLERMKHLGDDNA